VKYSNGIPQFIYYLLGEERVYFGSKYIGNANTGLMSGGTAVGQDRSRSVGNYFPYGEERNNPHVPNDIVKFATYTRDSAAGLDYADQRYHNSGLGRFLTMDRSAASLSLANPQSWNRYAYVLGDPANHNDPSGLCAAMLAGSTVGRDDGSPLIRNR
jgi:RHS repeat-associated protein